MIVELTVTSITVQPEISAVEIVVTPTFSSGDVLTAPIISISKNGVNIAPDELKNVDIEVPIATSELTNDSGFISEETDPVWNSEKGNYQLTSEKGQNNGYAGLDSGGKVPLANLPQSLLIYKGVWNPETNTPTLTATDLTAKGWYYKVTGLTGKFSLFGYNWGNGDWAIYNDLGNIELSDNSDEVTSVNGQTGAVSLDAGDVGASPLGHDHSGETINPDSVVLNETYSEAEQAAMVAGQIFYDADNKTIAFKVEDGGIIQINQEPHDYYTNLEGGNIVNGDIVSTCGASGNRTAICLTDATDDTKAVNAFGMCTVETIGNNNVGRITKSGGKVRGLNTIAYAEGTVLYVDPLNKGKWTATIPVAPNRPIIIGTVAVSHATQGVVELHISVAPKLSELADVDGTDTTIASGSSFLFKLTSGLWKTITESNFVTWLATYFGKLSTVNTWALLQTFTSGLKTTKIIPNSDTTGVVIRNAADTADVVKVDTAGGVSSLNGKYGFNTTVTDYYRTNTGSLFPQDYMFRSKAAGAKGLFGIDFNDAGTEAGFNFLNINTSGKIIRTAAFILLPSSVTAGSEAADLGFFTKPSSGEMVERARIKSDGKFGLNTTAPETTLDVNGTTTLRDWVYLNNGTHTGDAVGDRRYKIVSGIYEFQKCTVLNVTRGSGTWVADYKILANSSHQFGNDTNNVTIDANGTIKLNGTATVFDDLKASALSLQQTGAGISQNIPEACVEYTTGANTADYMVQSLQMPHTWKIGSVIYPHLHFRQTAAQVPNFLIQYRWQVNGQAETTAWTDFKCNTTAFAYTSGTINQIAHGGGLTPPVGAMLSDIVEFRIIRDTTNTSTLFTGADPLAATVRVRSFDIHVENDQLGGSNEEYIK